MSDTCLVHVWGLTLRQAAFQTAAAGPPGTLLAPQTAVARVWHIYGHTDSCSAASLLLWFWRFIGQLAFTLVSQVIRCETKYARFLHGGGRGGSQRWVFPPPPTPPHTRAAPHLDSGGDSRLVYFTPPNLGREGRITPNPARITSFSGRDPTKVVPIFVQTVLFIGIAPLFPLFRRPVCTGGVRLRCPSRAQCTLSLDRSIFTVCQNRELRRTRGFPRQEVT